MLSIEQCREILGEEAKSFSDGQIRKLRDTLDLFADVLFDTFLHHVRSERSGSKTQTGEEKVDTGRQSGILKETYSEQR